MPEAVFHISYDSQVKTVSSIHWSVFEQVLYPRKPESVVGPRSFMELGYSVDNRKNFVAGSRRFRRRIPSVGYAYVLL
jgi:hypothetical protein